MRGPSKKIKAISNEPLDMVKLSSVTFENVLASKPIPSMTDGQKEAKLIVISHPLSRLQPFTYIVKLGKEVKLNTTSSLKAMMFYNNDYNF